MEVTEDMTESNRARAQVFGVMLEGDSETIRQGIGMLGGLMSLRTETGGQPLVAAKMLRRRWIGIDISQQYVAIANARLQAVDTGVPAREAKNGQLALFGTDHAK